MLAGWMLVIHAANCLLPIPYSCAFVLNGASCLLQVLDFCIADILAMAFQSSSIIQNIEMRICACLVLCKPYRCCLTAGILKLKSLMINYAAFMRFSHGLLCFTHHVCKARNNEVSV